MKRPLSRLLSLVLCAAQASAAGQAPPAGSAGRVRVAVGDVWAPEAEWSRRGEVWESVAKALSHDARVTVVPADSLERYRQRLFAGKATAAEDLRRARESLAKGKGAYGRLKFSDGIDALSAARRLFVANLHELRSNRDLVDAHLYLGMSLAAVGKNEEAAEEFRRVVYLDPKRELSSREFSPGIVEIYSKARQEVLAQEPVRVQVESEPAEAAVYLNGRPAGKTPLTLQLAPGEYFFLVEAPGMAPWYRLEEVRKRVQVVRAELALAAGDARWARLFRVREGPEQRSDDVRVLDDLARAVKADLIFLGEVTRPKNYRVLGQLYDARTGGFSKVAVVAIGQDLAEFPAEAEGMAETLMGFVRPDGYLEAVARAQPDLRPEAVPVAGPRPAEQVSAAPRPKPWYSRWWIWPLLAGAGVGIYFGARELGGSKGARVVIDNSGNF